MPREELLHPLIAHFPIACLILSFFTKAAQLIVMKKYEQLGQNIQFMTRFLLYFGCAMLLPTIFLGDMAFDIVKPELCNTVLAYQHDELAEITLAIFVFGIFLEIGTQFKHKFLLPLNIAVLIVMGFGNYYLLETSHLGGKLVYEQGAGLIKERRAPCN